MGAFPTVWGQEPDQQLDEVARSVRLTHHPRALIAKHGDDFTLLVTPLSLILPPVVNPDVG
ncbi:hypothetical protein [Brooklawnia cerclae]|uniref:Uncharacterized protein n=1 Tax=Brooklawnia cerclae TaxID=349934 RepID=A0ABX0SEU9_9ACTN|nr:hypothetical protein [Brooklawnia cerclae]NIH56912.1 hypothetical protein [Brooklawnia cerclae]